MLWLLDLDYFQTGMDPWLSFYHNRHKEQSDLMTRCAKCGHRSIHE